MDATVHINTNLYERNIAMYSDELLDNIYTVCVKDAECGGVTIFANYYQLIQLRDVLTETIEKFAPVVPESVEPDLSLYTRTSYENVEKLFAGGWDVACDIMGRKFFYAGNDDSMTDFSPSPMLRESGQWYVLFN